MQTIHLKAQRDKLWEHKLPPRVIAGLLMALLALHGIGGSAQEPEGPAEILGEDLTIESIGAQVWRHVSYDDVPGFGRVPANGLVVVGDQEAALIDTPWTDEQTAALFAWVRRHLDAEITTVVPTHSHADCMGGLAAAHRLGAASYALGKTATFARRDGLEVPQNVFSDALELRIGQRTLKLHFAGAGHTVDNIVVWIPDERILFAGCLVKSAASRSLGYIEEADMVAWPKTLEALLRQYPTARLFVPGHGRPGGSELIENTLRLLRTQP